MLPPPPRTLHHHQDPIHATCADQQAQPGRLQGSEAGSRRREQRRRVTSHGADGAPWCRGPRRQGRPGRRGLRRSWYVFPCSLSHACRRCCGCFELLIMSNAANVFGKPKTNTDFLPYAGDGFKLMIPSKWNPSKEVEYPGQVLRYEDNFDSNSNVNVMVTPTTKSSITDYGTPGGFDSDAVATANILETTTQESGGKKYYFVSVLTRTADGDEGGKHQLITATVSDGKLYICKAQAGDKRWFKGARKFVESAASSFNVA
ncbi:hypothetical protein BHE74_00015688 [Ensete ventricosum]|nr:hypothetical protein BHE74_00015688 [Ensete ventricosum]